MFPTTAWSRNLDEPLPRNSVHNYSTPPIFEALSLLPLAYRVSSYISKERKEGREPIFDLNGYYTGLLDIAYISCRPQ
jgi:hypothetical protein